VLEDLLGGDLLGQLIALLGNRTNLAEAGQKGRDTGKRKAEQHLENTMPIITEITRQGAKTLRQIAAQLTARNIKTANGGAWTATAVKNIMDRCAAQAEQWAAKTRATGW
jgi:hypothetical protein